jgi:hypothetical protein
MKRMFLIVLGLFFVMCALLLEKKEAKAIPAFARKYRTSCTTCHVAIPKRNAFGEAFRRNGFVMPKGNAQLVKEEPVSLGAEAWKEVWPNTVWPGEIPASFPLAAYVQQRFTFEPLAKKGDRVEFDMPHEVELLFGGAFAEYLGFFGEWIAFESGTNAVGLQRFFFQFNDVFGKKNAFNVKVGRFEPGITSGYMNANRLTLDRPLTIDYRASGDWRPRDNQAGIEINGIFGHRMEYAVGMVNGQGNTVRDPDDRKDVFARVGFKLGGLGFDGEGAPVELKESDNWVDNALTVGAYTYWGSAKKTPSGRPAYENDFNRFGFDVRAGLERLELNGGLISGEDKNPFGDAKKLKHTVYFGELDYIFFPWLIGVARVNHAASKLEDDDRDKYWEFNPNLTLLYRANVRFTIEGRFRADEDRTIGGKTVKPTEKRAFRLLRTNIMFVF